MSTLAGAASDGTAAILATGRTDVSTLYVSMSARHPEGRDAAYLEWHSLDHRPEQYRLAGVRAALRLVSTPACRAVRAASHPRYDATDHLMTYFFSGAAGLKPFGELAVALTQAGRVPYLLPAVERAVYRLDGAVAAPRIKVGADVLPWWPARGVYVLIERGDAPVGELIEVPGVGGVWSGTWLAVDPQYTTTQDGGLKIAYCFLDDDAVLTAQRLRPVLEKRWSLSNPEPLFAAPFQVLVPYEWDRYLP
jgi:hypothetical protein